MPTDLGAQRDRQLCAALFATLAVLVPLGCGGEHQTPAAAPLVPGTDGFPRELTLEDGRRVALAARPERIVPANASAADFVLAVLGEAGRDRIASLTPETIEYSAVATSLAPWSVVRVGAHSAELLLAAAPDLVFDADWQDGGARANVVRAGVPVVTLPTVDTLDDLWTSIDLVGRALGEEARSTALAEDLKVRVTAAQERGARRIGTVLFYANYGSGGSAAGANTTSQLTLEIAGLTNAAAAFEGHVECGYEMLIVLDPEWIVVGDDGSDGPNTTRQHLESEPALAQLRAVKSGHIARLPRTLATSSSHTLVEAAEALLDELDRIDDAPPR